MTTNVERTQAARDAKAVAALDRARRCWDLRVAGLSWRQVAQREGYSDDAGAIRAVREAFGDVPEPDKAEFRALVTERLDFWNREAMRAYADATTVRDRTAAIRAGVQATTALARVTGVEADRAYSPVQAEMDAWVAAMLARGAGVALPDEPVVIALPVEAAVTGGL